MYNNLASRAEPIRYKTETWLRVFPHLARRVFLLRSDWFTASFTLVIDFLCDWFGLGLVYKHSNENRSIESQSENGYGYSFCFFKENANSHS